MLKESPPREGFLKDEDHPKLATECSKEGIWMRAIFECGCTFGWRYEELLILRVHGVDLVNRTLRLEASGTKNGRARTLVMTSLIYNLISHCVVGKKPDDHGLLARA